MQNLANDSVITYEYSTPNATAFQGYKVLQYDDSSYYIAGVQTINNNANVILLKIDSAGNRLWEKSYGQYKLDYAGSVIKLNNGNLLLGAVRNTADLTPTQHANTWLIEVDTGGNVARQWFDPNDSTYVAEGLLETQDGGFVYCARKKGRESGGLVSTVGTIVKMDNQFVKQWTYQGGGRSIYTGLTDIEVLPDGSILACGNNPYYAIDSNTLGGWVIKLSSAGQVIWERIYTGINQPAIKNFLSDIDVLPDGSLIAVGQCQNPGHTPPQVGWFLKLDSNGCEIENCVVGIEADHGLQTTGNSQIQVWPNPFTTDLSIALTGEHVTGATFTITNLMGQVVYQQTETNLATGYTKMLDLSYLANGVYFVAVNTGDRMMVERVVKE
ncbi:MAG TPA: T9SS type A sorting domain-containing protein [Chitinophagales bacterium]|nr:T9SS type A sorting domain-containing protein [Chitinophagales bacterium]